MKDREIIVKFDEVCSRDAYVLNRIEGTLKAESLIDLITIADLKANPREAKDSAVTDDIIESIENTPNIHHFKTKGILLAVRKCEPLQRNRFRLTFKDDEIEGVLDGGHNMFAAAKYFLKSVLKDPEKTLKGVKRWDELAEIWYENVDEIKLLEADYNFFMPLEVIFPNDTREGEAEFEEAILEIAQARNNNAQLTIETKANKQGLYEVLKVSIDPSLVDDVEWKTNDGGRIKARDLVSLSMIPLSLLSNDIPELKEFNPVSLYASKGTCVKIYNNAMEAENVSKKKGAISEVYNDSVKNALKLMKDIPKLYDLIYRDFPEAYNKASAGFGRIRSVRLYENNKYTPGEKKYLPRPPATKFYKQKCTYDFPDGFIMPIVYGLVELIERDGDTFKWKVDPELFLIAHLKDILQVYHGVISLAQFDPQRVGKSGASYQMVRSQISALLATRRI